MNIYPRQTNYSKKQTIESIKLDLEKKHTRALFIVSLPLWETNMLSKWLFTTVRY